MVNSDSVRRQVYRLFCGLLLLFPVFLPTAPVQASERPPKVVVSVKPLHSIVAGVMRGVAVPALLLSGAETPHSFALKPSHASALQGADIVFWVGPALERFLSKPVRTLAKDAAVVTLAKSVRLLPFRKQGIWDPQGETHAHGGHGHGHGHDHGQDANDPHFWLDPVRVRAIVPFVERALSAADPSNATRYRENATMLGQRLQGLHDRLKTILAPARQVPYLVFHDAYQYLETRYRLSAVGTVTLDPEIRPGAHHIAALRRTAEEHSVKCAFGEPQFKPATMSIIAEATAVRIGELDPLGLAQPPGPEAYFNMMTVLAQNLRKCLLLDADQGPTVKKN